MKVLITGQNALSVRDHERIAGYMQRLMHDREVEEVLFALSSFGGTFNGMTCVATTHPAISACATYALETAFSLARPGSPKLSAVVQHRQSDLPDSILQRVGGLYEFQLGPGYNPGYVAYVDRFPQLVEDCGQVTVFWDGNYIREPWDVVRGLRTRTMQQKYIAFEIIDLEGPPTVVETTREPKRDTKKRSA